MNAIAQAATPTMTSREIAALTEKQHFHVKRDIEKMLAELGEDATKFGCTYLDGQNRQQTEYALNRELTDVLLTGYSAVLRRKVIARWRELEETGAPRLPQTMAQALRLAADQAEQIEQQAAALALAAPKVDFVDRYVASDTGNKGFREVCKLLRAKENDFRAFLTDRGIMYRLGGEWTPYADQLNTGRFVVKTGTAEHGDTAHAYNQAKFTPKGVAWVAGEWAKHNLPT